MIEEKLEGASGIPSTPWERRKDFGLVIAFFETAIQVFLRPAMVFSRIGNVRSIWDPLMYHFYVNFVNVLIGILMFVVLGFNPFADLIPDVRWKFFAIGSIVILSAVVGVVFAIFAYSLLMHICVRIFKGKGGFRGTFQVLCYSSSLVIPMLLAALVFVVIIRLGQEMVVPEAVSIWTLIGFSIFLLAFYIFLFLRWAYVIVVGYGEIHDLAGGRAWAAVAASVVVITIFQTLVGVWNQRNVRLTPIQTKLLKQDK